MRELNYEFRKRMLEVHTKNRRMPGKAVGKNQVEITDAWQIVVNDKNEFLGGCISIGIKTGVKALSTCTARLPEVELVRPKKVMENSMIRSIQSGIIYGMTGQVEYIVGKLRQEMGCPDCKVIATGGLSQLLSFDDPNFISVVDRGLSLEGLNILYHLNKEEK
ncbi:MAG: type III pantothenate kinase [Clostridia bacterium]|nr:type III pantothenate kinase [Clostridia bacterium]